jgi:hypothetical protein
MVACARQVPDQVADMTELDGPTVGGGPSRGHFFRDRKASMAFFASSDPNSRAESFDSSSP